MTGSEVGLHYCVLTFWGGKAWENIEIALTTPLKVGKEARRRHAGKWKSLSRDQIEEVTNVLSKTGSYTIVPSTEFFRMEKERYDRL